MTATTSNRPRLFRIGGILMLLAPVLLVMGLIWGDEIADFFHYAFKEDVVRYQDVYALPDGGALRKDREWTRKEYDLNHQSRRFLKRVDAEGKELWRFRYEDIGIWRSSLKDPNIWVAKDVVVFKVGEYDHPIFVFLDLETGEKLWSRAFLTPIDYLVSNAFLVSEDRFYHFHSQGKEDWGDFGKCVIYDIRTGDFVEEKKLETRGVKKPAVYENSVIFHDQHRGALIHFDRESGAMKAYPAGWFPIVYEGGILYNDSLATRILGRDGQLHEVIPHPQSGGAATPISAWSRPSHEVVHLLSEQFGSEIRLVGDSMIRVPYDSLYLHYKPYHRWLSTNFAQYARYKDSVPRYLPVFAYAPNHGQVKVPGFPSEATLSDTSKRQQVLVMLDMETGLPLWYSLLERAHHHEMEVLIDGHHILVFDESNVEERTLALFDGRTGHLLRTLETEAHFLNPLPTQIAHNRIWTRRRTDWVALDLHDLSIAATNNPDLRFRDLTAGYAEMMNIPPEFRPTSEPQP